MGNRLTNLQIVNEVLDALGSDEVNATDDTFESGRILTFIKQAYLDLIFQGNFPHLLRVVNLTATDANTPNYMQVGTDVIDIDWIKYDVKTSGSVTNFRDIIYCEPAAFIENMLNRDTSASNVDSITDIGGGGSVLYVYNDRMPALWTSFDDEYIIFDSYDSSVETFLAASKSRAQVYTEPTWDPSDGAYPELPSRHFPGLVSEVTSMAFAHLRQVPNGKAEQQSRRQRHERSRRRRGRSAESTRIPDYGRRGPGSYSRDRLTVGRNRY